MLRRVGVAPALRRSSVFARQLRAAAALAAGFVVLTVLVAGPLHSLDLALNGERDIDWLKPLLFQLDRIGQRAVCLPILFLVAGVAARRARSWRPVVVAAAGAVVVNLVVGALKIGLERGAPLDSEPGFLEGGVMYPSGHAANVVLVYGLAAYLWWRYHGASRRTRHLMTAMVVALTVVMVSTSLLLRWHWFTDLVGGVLVGAIVLRFVTAFDRAVPFTPLPPTAAAAVVTRPAQAERRDTALTR